MHIGQQIVQLRLEKGWTQKELARHVKINVSVMNRIESGDRPVKGEELAELATVLDVTADHLLGIPNQHISQKREQKNEVIENIQKKFPAADSMLHDLASLRFEDIKDVYEFVLFKKSQQKK